MWDLAEAALREADSIAFLGYRFPPTDAQARKRLLGAIEANEKSHVTFHTVLGESSPDTLRLQGMINSVCARAGRGPHMSKKHDLRAHAMRAEDFFNPLADESDLDDLEALLAQTTLT